MPTSFPTAIDNFVNPTGASKQSDLAVLHHEQHTNVNDAVKALETKVGVTDSMDNDSLEVRVTFCEGYAHTLAGTSRQIVVTPDEDGNLILSLPQNIDSASNPVFRDVTVRRISGNTRPSVVFGPGAGTGHFGSVSAGDEMMFRLDLTTGSDPAAGNATLATFTYAVAFANAPLVAIIPNSPRTNVIQAAAATAALVAGGGGAPGGFQVNSGATALAANQSYSWIFLVQGK